MLRRINNKMKKGFTLVELLITIAIIGLMSAMILPKLFGPTEQSRSAEARNMLGTVRQLEEAYRNSNGNYLEIAAADDEDWETLGIENPNDAPNNYFSYTVDVDNNGNYIAIANRLDGSMLGTICLNRFGTWSGTYRYVPKNPGGDACDGNTEECCA